MRKILLALSIGFAPFSVFCEEHDFAFDVEEEMEESVAVEEPSNELKEIVGAMKSDRTVNKERVKRIKHLLKEKGWSKKSNQEDDLAQNES